MLHEQHGPEGVYLEGLEGMVVVYLGGRLFGVEDTGDGEGEVKVGGLLWECRRCLRGGVHDGLFVCEGLSIVWRVMTSRVEVLT